tara:strand:- start:16394 stop:18046 length:1653 start_codon:yes stop_codon:yes gene_type:complete
MLLIEISKKMNIKTHCKLSEKSRYNFILFFSILLLITSNITNAQKRELASTKKEALVVQSGPSAFELLIQQIYNEKLPTAGINSLVITYKEEKTKNKSGGGITIVNQNKASKNKKVTPPSGKKENTYQTNKILKSSKSLTGNSKFDVPPPGGQKNKVVKQNTSPLKKDPNYSTSNILKTKSLTGDSNFDVPPPGGKKSKTIKGQYETVPPMNTNFNTASSKNTSNRKGSGVDGSSSGSKSIPPPIPPSLKRTQNLSQYDKVVSKKGYESTSSTIGGASTLQNKTGQFDKGSISKSRSLSQKSKGYDAVSSIMGGTSNSLNNQGGKTLSSQSGLTTLPTKQLDFQKNSTNNQYGILPKAAANNNTYNVPPRKVNTSPVPLTNQYSNAQKPKSQTYGPPSSASKITKQNQYGDFPQSYRNKTQYTTPPKAPNKSQTAPAIGKNQYDIPNRVNKNTYDNAPKKANTAPVPLRNQYSNAQKPKSQAYGPPPKAPKKANTVPVLGQKNTSASKVKKAGTVPIIKTKTKADKAKSARAKKAEKAKKTASLKKAKKG